MVVNSTVHNKVPSIYYTEEKSFRRKHLVFFKYLFRNGFCNLIKKIKKAKKKASRVGHFIILPSLPLQRMRVKKKKESINDGTEIYSYIEYTVTGERNQFPI